VEVSGIKEVPADSRRKDDADFLINVLGLPPIDQWVFSVEVSGKKVLRRFSQKKERRFLN
jgi:hypothetical protein